MIPGKFTKTGLLKKLDVDKLTVQIANLETEKLKALKCCGEWLQWFKSFIGHAG